MSWHEWCTTFSGESIKNVIFSPLLQCYVIIFMLFTQISFYLQFAEQLIVLCKKFHGFVLIVSNLQEVRMGFSQLQMHQLSTLQQHIHTNTHRDEKPRPCLHRGETLLLHVHFLWMTWIVNTSLPSTQCTLCSYSLFTVIMYHVSNMPGGPSFYI